MFNALKDQAVEIDTKLRGLRKQCTTFGIGYVEEDESKQHFVREAITAAKGEVRDCTADCDSLVDQTHTLFTVLTEADKAADEIYDSVIKFYYAQGVKVPPIQLDTLSVGFPIDLLPMSETGSAEQTEERPAFSTKEGRNSDSECQEEFVSEIYITRPPGDDGLPPETPMIKSRKRLF